MHNREVEGLGESERERVSEKMTESVRNPKKEFHTDSQLDCLLIDSFNCSILANLTVN